MNTITTALNSLLRLLPAVSPLADRLGLTLLHTLWQGLAIALLLIVANWTLRRAAPQARYLASCLAMFLFLAAAIATFIAIPPRAKIAAIAETPKSVDVPFHSANNIAEQPVPVIDPALINNPEVTPAAHVEAAPIVKPAAPQRNSFASAVTPWLPTLALFWAIGILLLSTYRIGGWLFLNRLIARAAPSPAAAIDMLNTLRQSLCVAAPVRLLQSVRVNCPCTVGWLRPAILVPLSILTELPPDQLQAILAHELAHIRRHDYLVNLLQTAIETLLFYHPATWWISRQIRNERENCCDDIAAKTSESPVIYARALAKLEERRLLTFPALAATGGPLLARIRRILGRGESPRPAFGTILAFILALILVACSLVSHEHQPQTAVATTQPSTLPSGQAEIPGPWSNTAMGLRARLVPPTPTLKAGDLASFPVEIQNATDRPINYESFGAMIRIPDLQDTEFKSDLEARSWLGAYQSEPGKGSRLLTEREVQDRFGISRQFPQPEKPMPGYFELQPGGSVFIKVNAPWVFPRAKSYHVDAQIPLINPISNSIYRADETNALLLNEEELKIEAGDPAAARVYDTHWGPITNGLRAGLQFVGGFRPVPQFGYGTWSLIVENTTDKPISFTYTSGEEQEDMPTVTDSKGKQIPVTVARVETDTLRYNAFVLDPHKSMGLANPNFWIGKPGANDSEPCTPTLRAGPGQYQVTYKFRFKPQGATQWSGAVVSGEAPLTITNTEAAIYPVANLRERDDTTSWGSDVDGVSCRAWIGPIFAYDAPTGGKRTVPLIFLDVQNAGAQNYFIPQTQTMWKLDIDGTAYKWTGDVETKSSPLPPGRTAAYIHLDLDNPAWKDAMGNPLHLLAGPHKLRAAPSDESGDAGIPLNIQTEELAFQVLAGDDKPQSGAVVPATMPATQPAAQAIDTSLIELDGQVIDDPTGRLIQYFDVEWGWPDPQNGGKIGWGGSKQTFDKSWAGHFRADTGVPAGLKIAARVIIDGYDPQMITPDLLTSPVKVDNLVIRMKRSVAPTTRAAPTTTPFTTLAELHSSDPLLKKLIAADNAVLNDATVHASVLYPLNELNTEETERLKYQVRFTYHQGTWAADSMIDPSVSAPKFTAEGDPLSHANGIDIVWRTAEVRSLFDSHTSASRSDNVLFTIKSDGSTKTERNTAPMLQLNQPFDLGFPDPNLSMGIFGSGRGFSMYIDSIKESHPEGSLLRCEAIGKSPIGGLPVSWSLLLDPQNDMLVRNARATFNNTVILEIKTTGVLTTSRGTVVQKSTYAVYPNSDENARVGFPELTYTSIDNSADLQLIENNRKLMTPPLEKHTWVLDNRGPIEHNYRVGEDDPPQSPYPTEAAPATQPQRGAVVPLTMPATMPAPARSAATTSLEIHCVDTDDKPVANAQVYLLQALSIKSGDPKRESTLTGPLTSDAAGRVEFKDVATIQKYSSIVRQVYARVPGKLVGVFSQFEDIIPWEFDNPSSSLNVIMYPAASVQGIVNVPAGRTVTDVKIHTATLSSPNPNSPLLSIVKNADTHAVLISPSNFALAPTPEFERRSDLSTDAFLSDVYDVTPNADGTFTITDVPANGGLDLVAIAPGMARERLAVTAVNHPNPPTFNMIPQAIVQGRVTQPDGKPTAGVKLHLSGAFASENMTLAMENFSAITDTDGHYSIDQLPGEPVFLTLDSTADYVIPPTTIELTSGSAAIKDLQLSQGTLVTGSVTDAKGTAIPNVAIQATSTPDQMYLGSATTDAQGRYSLRLPGGSCRLDLGKLPPGFARPLQKGEVVTTDKGVYSIVYSELAQTISVSADAAKLDGPTFVLKTASTEPSQSP